MPGGIKFPFLGSQSLGTTSTMTLTDGVSLNVGVDEHVGTKSRHEGYLFSPPASGLAI
jgi:hypothetical protein